MESEEAHVAMTLPAVGSVLALAARPGAAGGERPVRNSGEGQRGGSGHQDRYHPGRVVLGYYS